MNAVNADLDERALAGFLDGLLHLLLSLAHYLLDSAGVDAAVGNQPFERYPRDFAADWVVAGNHHRFRSVVDDDIDAGSRFDGAYIAALAADDAALHFVVGQSQHRNRAFGDEFSRQTFDGDRNNAFGTAVRLLTRLFLDHANMPRGLVAGLSDHFFHQSPLGFLACQSGDRFQLRARLVD